jgi:hypothetical protein
MTTREEQSAENTRVFWCACSDGCSTRAQATVSRVGVEYAIQITLIVGGLEYAFQPYALEPFCRQIEAKARKIFGAREKRIAIMFDGAEISTWARERMQAIDATVDTFDMGDGLTISADLARIARSYFDNDMALPDLIARDLPCMCAECRRSEQPGNVRFGRIGDSNHVFAQATHGGTRIRGIVERNMLADAIAGDQQPTFTLVLGREPGEVAVRLDTQAVLAFLRD